MSVHTLLATCRGLAFFVLILCWGTSAIAESPDHRSTLLNQQPVKSTTTSPRSGPSDSDIFLSHAFDEPLVPIGGTTTPEENAALSKAIALFTKRTNQDDNSAIIGFFGEFPKSPWRASLLLNLGLEYRRTGWFLKALTAWDEAWRLSKGETSPAGKAQADRAIGELAELNARVGRRQQVEAILKEIEGRRLVGPATVKIVGAREGVWLMHHEPGKAFKCGPFALDRIRAFRDPATALDPKIQAARSSDHGMSLDQVCALANDLKMDYQMAKRAPGAPVIVPSVVNWKAKHYAALVKEQGGRFLVQDPTFGTDIWVTKAALDAEATGYFLVAQGGLPKGWREVDADEGKSVWGMGQVSSHDNTGTKTNDDKAKCPGQDSGMAVYNFHTQLVSLNIMDTPVGYTPPRGPDAHLTVTYNQREADQPSTFNFSNFGPKWTCNWLSYLTDSSSNPGVNTVNLNLAGGGTEPYLHTGTGVGQYSPQFQSGALLTLVSTNPIRYERQLPDGSRQVFNLPDGTGRVYMTQIIDPTGNILQLTYDGTFRITQVTDALGQVTTITHQSDNPSVLPDYYLIKRVTDPFGRSATFEYQNGELWKIHDVIGITSQFAYAIGSDFINSMTTPYGTTTFSQPASPLGGIGRVIQATDPTGAVERLEYGDNAPGISSLQPDVPLGAGNGFFQFRNSFYWDKNAMAMYPPDPTTGLPQYTKAKLTQWLHTHDGNSASNVKEREKQPLENAVYYFYGGQPAYYYVGFNAFPEVVARLMSDGSSQAYRYTYDHIGTTYDSTGKVTQSVDPIGRTTEYFYDTNNIDLLTVYQVNPQGVSTDPNGFVADKIASYTYNSQHELLTATDAAGQKTTYTYRPDGHGQIQSVQNPRSETTNYSYGPVTGVPTDYLASITSPTFNGSQAVTSFTYDTANRIHTVTNSPDNYTVTTTYDNLERPTQISYPDGTNRQFQYTQDFGQGLQLIPELTVSQDRRGRVTTRHYNSNRQMDSVTEPLTSTSNRTTRYGWCVCGALTSITDPDLHVTLFNRDLESRVYQKVFAAGTADSTSVSYTYENATSRLQSTTDALNQTTNYQYFIDNTLKQVSYTNALQATPTVSFTYDPNYSRVQTMTDGTGTTNYTYYPITSTPTFSAGRLKTVDVPPHTNDAITYTYDELGRAVSQSINGVASSVRYDSLGRLDTSDNALGHFSRTYDGTGNVTPRLKTLNFPNAQTANYSYFDNSHDRRLQTLQNLAGGVVNLSKFDHTYDPEGQIQTLAKQLGTTIPGLTGSYGYDLADEITSAVSATVIPPFSSAYGYDASGNRTTDQVPPGTHMFNNLNQTQDPGYVYDKNGNLASDGPNRTYSWDAANRLIAIQEPQPNTPSPGPTLTDAASRKTHGAAGTFDIDLPLSGTPGVECRSGGVNGNYTTVFTFSENLTAVDASVVTPCGTVSSAQIGPNQNQYTVNLTGVCNAQYVTITLTGVHGTAGGITPSTSATMGVLVGDTNSDGFVNSADISQTGSQSGQPVSGANFREDVNADGFINSADVSLARSRAGTALPAPAPTPPTVFTRSEFTYDGLGRRVRMVEKQANSVLNPVWVTVSDHLYVWSGSTLAEERDSTGATVTKRFFAEGEQINGTNYYYTRDHLGSIREMTDSTAAIRAQYEYDPYGIRTKISGNLDADFGFTGYWNHAPSGLNLSLYRAYSPTLGRWLSRDPIGEEGGLNLYGYVTNNPTNKTDPLGLAPCEGHTFRDCLRNCYAANGGGWALAALGLGGPFASIPSPISKTQLGSQNPYTSIFSLGARGLGFSGVARAARVLNPYANVVTAAAGGWLIGLSASCSAMCAADSNSW